MAEGHVRMTDSAPELTAELIVDGAVPAQPVISPDGRWVSYAVAPTGKRGEHRLSAIWIAAADASSPPRKLTAGTAADSAPRWAPDSAALFFVSDRTGSAQLHRIRLDGGEAEALTAWRSGIDGHYPLAGGRVVAVLAADEPTQEDERRKQAAPGRPGDGRRPRSRPGRTGGAVAGLVARRRQLALGLPGGAQAARRHGRL